LIPAATLIPVETMRKLLDLANEGATIIFHKSIPSDVPGYGMLPQRRAELKELLSTIPFNSVEPNNVKTTSPGKGLLLLGGNIDVALTEGKIRKEKMAASGLQFIRKKNDEGNVYFISNPGKSFEGWVPLHLKAETVTIFEPMMGKTGIAKIRNAAGADYTEVYLKLDSGESCILQTELRRVSGARYPYYAMNGEPQEISGTWNVKFISGGPSLPKPAQLSSVGSWTDIPGQASKDFSGTAEYSLRFNKPSGNATWWVLDLGIVEESAEVTLNNKKLATLIGPSYRVVIPASSLLASNLLQVQVTNGMANRIISLEKKGVQWKKFYNVNFPSRLPANRGSDGIFTAAKWQPLPSGLIGPVTITPLKAEE